MFTSTYVISVLKKITCISDVSPNGTIILYPKFTQSMLYYNVTLISGRKEMFILFIWHQIYVKDCSHSKTGNHCCHFMGYSFQLAARGSYICTFP